MYQKDNENAVRISLKLNKILDSDILEAIGETQKQTNIKRLIRERIAKATAQNK